MVFDGGIVTWGGIYPTLQYTGRLLVYEFPHMLLNEGKRWAAKRDAFGGEMFAGRLMFAGVVSVEYVCCRLLQVDASVLLCLRCRTETDTDTLPGLWDLVLPSACLAVAVIGLLNGPVLTVLSAVLEGGVTCSWNNPSPNFDFSGEDEMGFDSPIDSSEFEGDDGVPVVPLRPLSPLSPLSIPLIWKTIWRSNQMYIRIST